MPAPVYNLATFLLSDRRPPVEPLVARKEALLRREREIMNYVDYLCERDCLGYFGWLLEREELEAKEAACRAAIGVAPVRAKLDEIRDECVAQAHAAGLVAARAFLLLSRAFQELKGQPHEGPVSTRIVELAVALRPGWKPKPTTPLSP